MSRAEYQGYPPNPLRLMRCLLLFCVLPGVVACHMPEGSEPRATDVSQSPVLPLSGLEFQSVDVQQLQADDFANPGMLWVDRGAALWTVAEDDRSCADCHGEAERSLRGAAASLPRVRDGQLVNLEGQINRCRERQGRADLAYDSEMMLALSAYVAHQSRGMPRSVAISGDAQPFWARGRDYFYARRGQLDLACAHCHESYVGRQLRGDRLSQGQSNGYPLYRLEWQGLGSLHRRLQFCNTGVRAQPFAAGAQPYLDLELYLAWRGAGLSVEAPAVRR
ncbi:MAG: sulfur oxidation c-type cytochrome SoxA [Pseudomonadota bacterium]